MNVQRVFDKVHHRPTLDETLDHDEMMARYMLDQARESHRLADEWERMARQRLEEIQEARRQLHPETAG